MATRARTNEDWPVAPRPPRPASTRTMAGRGGAAPATSLEEAVSRVGDRWSLLVINALLDGPSRFNDLVERLDGLAPNILSNRLRTLERDGIVMAVPYSRRPPRFSYRLSASGTELAGAIRLLAQWGAGEVPGAPHAQHATCGTPVEARWYCPTCARVVDRAEETEGLDFV